MQAWQGWAPERQVVCAVGAEAIPFSKAEELDAEVSKMSAAVGEWATKRVGAFAPGDSAAATAAKFSVASEGAFFLDFRTFKLDWDAFVDWRRANPPPLWVPVPSIAMTDLYGDLPKYRALLDRYQQLLERAKLLGVQTTASVPDQRSPVEKGLAEGAGKAVGTLGEIGTYAVAGAVVLGALYLLGPLIWAAVRR